MIKTTVVLSLATLAIASSANEAYAGIEIFNYSKEHIGVFKKQQVIIRNKNPRLFSIKTDVPSNLKKISSDPFGYKDADLHGQIAYDILPMFGLDNDLIPKTVKYKVVGNRKVFTIQGRKKLSNGRLVLTSSKVFSVPATRTRAFFLWGSEVKLVR
jgi:hypothetical protein